MVLGWIGWVVWQESGDMPIPGSLPEALKKKSFKRKGKNQGLSNLFGPINLSFKIIIQSQIKKQEHLQKTKTQSV